MNAAMRGSRRHSLSLLAMGLLLAACQDDPPAASTVQTDGPAPGTQATGEPVVVTEKSFKCIHEMTPVRGFFVDNIAGNLEGTLAAANTTGGAIYPPGSVVQLFPNEVMVKREQGYNPITKDWEFFELDVAESGSTIRKRGFQDVVNRFGGNCFACHIQAKPQWDLICEDDHGCAALPINDLALTSLQNTDPRCKTKEASLSERITAWFIKVFTPL